MVRATSEDRGARYYKRVYDKIMANSQARPDVSKWAVLQGLDLKDHIPNVFAAAGYTDPSLRISQVESAVKQQQQMLAERKARKKERMKEAVRGANKSLPEDGDHHGEEKSKHNLTDKLMNAVEASFEKEEEKWHEVQTFKTRDEAVGFIMECQPFSYQPEIEKGDEPCPRFENSRDAVAHILQMNPVPSRFTSIVPEFKRRLRIRLQDVDQRLEEEKHARRLITHRGRRRSQQNNPVTPHEQVPKPTAELKPWVVETTGEFFESPASLRDLREAGTKYFIAVPQDIAPIVLQEGYRVKQRFSVPCSGTPGEALEAFDRNEKKAGRKTKAVVLPVTLSPEYDVVTHRNGGFLIRTKELPPSCFRVKKAGPTGADGQ